MAKRYTEEEIRYFTSLPIVKMATQNRLTLTFGFREELYSKWKESPGTGIIRKMLEEAGITYSLVGYEYIHSLNKNFIKHGAPRNGKSCVVVRNPEKKTKLETNRILLDTGYFVEKGNHVTFSQDYLVKLMDRYPEISLEECLRQDGIDPQLVGYQRIYILKRKLDQGMNPAHHECNPQRQFLTEDQVEAAKVHPYILRVSRKHLVLSSSFYCEAKLLESNGMKIDSILEIFELPNEWFSPSRKFRMKYDIRSAGPADPIDASFWNLPQYVRIQRRKLIQLEKLAAQEYARTKEKLSNANQEDRIQVYKWIREIPTGKRYQDSLSQILRQLGICRSRFYHMCTDDFKNALKARREREERDMESVRMTAEFGGYPKGSRQIYMQMDSVANRHMSRKKIRCLMKKGGITCPVRKSNSNRQAAQEHLKTHVKPNLVRRRFRLNRPGKVFLTDVTYLDYGKEQRAYGSASIDAVTGEVMDFTVSCENNLALVEETILALPDGRNESSESGKRILHSDQGILYLADSFQETVRSRDFEQSMSKRGNCWDNSPQESFFGHFKDECPYKNAATLKELQETVREYVIYYNTQRGQWTRNRMTPEAYREWLLAMDDDRFSVWMDEQEKMYADKKKRAEQKAIEHSRTLGI